VLFVGSHPLWKSSLLPRGGMKEAIFTFQIFGEYCKLMLAIDISLLDKLIGHFNTNAMDFFML
jgi:hypothetical protein